MFDMRQFRLEGCNQAIKKELFKVHQVFSNDVLNNDESCSLTINNFWGNRLFYWMPPRLTSVSTIFFVGPWVIAV